MAPRAAALTYSWVLVGNAESWAQVAPPGSEYRGLPGRCVYIWSLRSAAKTLNLPIWNMDSSLIMGNAMTTRRLLFTHSFFFSFFFKFYFFFILLYNAILVLPYIDMNPPRLYMNSQSWIPLPPPTPYHLSGSSPCTSPKHPVSCIKHRLALRFLHDSFKRTIIKSSKGKTTNNTQGDSHKDNSWSFNRNSSGQKGVAGYT